MRPAGAGTMMSRPQVPGRTARGLSRLPFPGDQCTPQGPVPTREPRFSPENPASVLCLYRNTLGVRKNGKPSGGGFFPTNTRTVTGGSTASFDAGARSKAGPIAPTRPPRKPSCSFSVRVPRATCGSGSNGAPCLRGGRGAPAPGRRGRSLVGPFAGLPGGAPARSDPSNPIWHLAVSG